MTLPPRGVLLAAVLLLSLSALAQTPADLLDDLAEELDDEGRLTNASAEQLADLRQLLDEPLDLNTCTAQDLARLPFLGEAKARRLLHRRERIGAFLSEQELMLLPGFTLTDIDRLLTYCRVRPPGPMRLDRRIVRAEALGRLQSAWPRQRGYTHHNDTTPAFAGKPLKTLLKLKADVGGRWKAGLTLETDPGEPRLCRQTPLADYVGGYAAFESGGLVQRAVIGNFQVRLGQGLGIWTGFGLAPTLSNVSPARTALGVTPSMSCQENNILRGAAVDLRMAPLRATLFASLVRADATLRTDSLGRDYITAERTDGLHRTATERGYRHNDPVRTLGAYVSFDHGAGRVGLGYNDWHTRLPLRSDGRPYHQGMPEGNDIGTLHLDYRLFVGRLSLRCEGALQGDRGWAGTAIVDLALGKSTTLSLAARRFANSYWAHVQNPVCQTSRAGGEGGIYIGVEGRPEQRLTLRASADVYHVRVQQMNVLCPQWAVKARGEARLDFNRQTSLALRVRHTTKEGTYRPDPKRLSYVVARLHTTSYKALVSAQPTPRVRLKSAVEAVRAVSVRQKVTSGWLVCQSVQALSPRGIVQGAACAAWFHTSSYEARVYATQPNVLGDMSFGTCSGHGLRLTAMIKVTPIESLRLWLWAQGMQYLDGRDVISSGHTEVKGDRQLTVKLQAQWKLWKRTGHRRWAPELPSDFKELQR